MARRRRPHVAACRRGLFWHITALATIIACRAARLVHATELETWTLETAVQRALLFNPELVRLASDYEVSRLEREAGRAAYNWRWRPFVGADSGGQTRTHRAGIDLLRRLEWGTEIALGTEIAHTRYQDTDSADRQVFRLSAQHPLFRYAGGAEQRLAAERADRRARMAWRAIEIAKTETVWRVVQIFYQWQRAMMDAAAARELAERLVRLQGILRLRVQTGRAAPVELWRLETMHAEAEARERAAQAQLARLRMALANQLGFPLDQPLSVAMPPWPEPTDEPVEAIIQTAWRNRLEIAQAEEARDEAQLNVRIAERQRLPDLRLSASVERRHAEGMSGDETWWSIGLRASDFSGTSAKYDLLRARLAESQAAGDVEAARRAVEQQVREACLDLERAQTELQAATRRRELATFRHRRARRLFEMGRGDSPSVSDAESQQQEAERAWLQAQTDAALAAFRLRLAAGTLLEAPPVLKPRGDAEKMP